MLTLRNFELRSSIVDSLFSDTEPRNTVIRSIPMGGSKVEKKTTVKLYLSKGQESQPDTTFLDIYDY
jgi:beta-lactam-binding protein with PASTA domain